MIKRGNSLAIKSIVFLLTCFACNTSERQGLNREQFIIKNYNEYPLFDTGFYFRDSVKKINDMLMPSKYIYDSVNRLFIEKHSVFVEDCNVNSFFIINNLLNKYSFLPFPDERLVIQDRVKNGSLINANTFFYAALLKVIEDNNIKNKAYFLHCVFDSLLMAKPIQLNEMKFANEIQKDSVLTVLDLKKTSKTNFYKSMAGDEAYWAIIYYDDSVKVYFINSNKIECFIL